MRHLLLKVTSGILILFPFMVDGFYNYGHGYYNKGHHGHKGVDFDYEVIYNGIFDPNMVAIHVAQNFFNFVISSIGWFGLVIPAYSYYNIYKDDDKDKGKSSDYTMNYENENERTDNSVHSRWKRAMPEINSKRVAQILRFLADSAENFDK